MVNIIAHRGLWATLSEQNTERAIQKAFEQGYGIETDLRGVDGKVVLSHDVPRTSGLVTFESLLSIYTDFDSDLPLALNVKCDGLQDIITNTSLYNNMPKAYFFDMSTPDTVQYMRRGLPFYTRISEYEVAPILVDQASGIWLDFFECWWLHRDTIAHDLVGYGLPICMVSPELHKRPYKEDWSRIKEFQRNYPEIDLSICTDLPESAEEFFNG